MNYKDIVSRCDDSKYLISMTSIDELIRFGYSIGLNEQSSVLDLCCGYGTVLKIWSEAFGISGTGVDRHQPFLSEGRRRLTEAGIDKIKLVESDVLNYTDDDKYDVVICSETIDTMRDTLAIGEKFLKSKGVLAYQKVFSKIPNPPQELIDFEGELLPLSELNRRFNELGYYITHMASDSNSEWERYITSNTSQELEHLRQNPDDEKAKNWLDKWYRMYFDYRRPYENQALFGLMKL